MLSNLQHNPIHVHLEVSSIMFSGHYSQGTTVQDCSIAAQS